MKKKKFLLALSSTEQSLDAAQLTWSLAEQAGAIVDAVHVVNSTAAWQLLNFEVPGFLGSGVHIEAHKSIKTALAALGRTLLEVYTARAAGRNAVGQAFLDEGEPVEKIVERAAGYDMVILGHRPKKLRGPNERYMYEFSVAERLAEQCPVPLLVVQDKMEPWQYANIVMSMDHVNKPYLLQAASTSRNMGIWPEIVCLYSGVREEQPARFIADLKQSEPELKGETVRIKQINDRIVKEGLCTWIASQAEVESMSTTPSLLILPTHGAGRERETVFGTPLPALIKELAAPGIMFWPEIFSLTQDAPEEQTREISKV